jgi:hypothetical protein
MNDINEIVLKIREYVFNKRKKIKDKSEIDIFFINMLEISASLAELGISQGREISVEEEEWYKGSYHLDYWDSDFNDKYYWPLTQKVKELNYFRPR